jgi:hypothetical protein
MASFPASSGATQSIGGSSSASGGPAAGGGCLAGPLSAAGGPVLWTEVALTAAGAKGGALLGLVLPLDGADRQLTAHLGKGTNGAVFKVEAPGCAVQALKLPIQTVKKEGVEAFVWGVSDAAAEAAASAAAAAVCPGGVHVVKCVQAGPFAATLSDVATFDAFDYTWRGRRPCFNGVTAFVFKQMLFDVGELHAADWVIGDIKPDNFLLFVCDKTGDVVVKLADLGGAWWPGCTTATAAKTISPAFADPALKGVASQQNDAWSVGATGFFLLCGRFLGDKLAASLTTVGAEKAEEELTAAAKRHLGVSLTEHEARFVKQLSLLLVKGGERATVGDAYRHFTAAF